MMTGSLQKTQTTERYGKKMDSIKVSALYNTEETIAKELFKDDCYPWEILPKIKDFILTLGPTLPKDKFDEIEKNVWVAKSAVVAKTASITGPWIIDEDTEVRHCAFIRGNALVGKHCVVGNSTELKNVILFNNVQVPHYNYVGDSILGFKSHMGAGSITSNVKSDKTLVEVKVNGEVLPTGLKKMGAILGDQVEVGCGSILNPGTIVGSNTNIYPLSSVRGYVPGGSIYKKQGEIAQKR